MELAPVCRRRSLERRALEAAAALIVFWPLVLVVVPAMLGLDPLVLAGRDGWWVALAVVVFLLSAVVAWALPERVRRTRRRRSRRVPTLTR